ncbi:MAG: hypothetical protein KUG79_17130 [Pseudomonadales bacterium]|nr:hypothetical protein [Pseudomonadales bacterium]
MTRLILSKHKKVEVIEVAGQPNILMQVLEETEVKGIRASYFLVSGRYVGQTLDDVRHGNLGGHHGAIALSIVLPEKLEALKAGNHKESIKYLGVGTCHPIEENPYRTF